MPTPEFDSTDLARLRSQLQAWRRHQSGRPRLPQSLWQAAAILARSHGVSCVARTLRLGYPTLRRLVDPLERDRVARPTGLPSLSAAPSGFVELRLPAALAERPSLTRSSGAIELTGPSQRRLRIEMSVDPELCVRLVEDFWSAEP